MRDNDVKKTSAIAFALIVVAALLWLIIGIPEAKGQVNALFYLGLDEFNDSLDAAAYLDSTNLLDDGVGEEDLSANSVGDEAIDFTDVTLVDFTEETAYRTIYVDENGDVQYLTHGTDGFFLKSNGASADPTWASAGGGNTAYDDIADPDAAASISFSDASYSGTYTSDQAGWVGITVSNTVADVGETDQALLSLEYIDDDDEDAVFMVCMDSTDAEDTTVIIGTDGVYLARRHADSALVTKGYGDENWSGGSAIKWIDSAAVYDGWGLEVTLAGDDTLRVKSEDLEAVLITGVTAGDGLTGDATEGTASLAVGAGTGITVNANDVEATLGDAITSGEITDGEVTEADLNIATASPADNEILTFNDGGTNFDWHTPTELALMEDEDINTFAEIQAWVSDKTLVNEEDIFTIDANWVNTANPWAVNEGGTGAATFTDGGVLIGNGTGAVQATAVLTNGQLLIGDGTTDPTVATMTEGTGMTITNGVGSITLATTLGTTITTDEISNLTIKEEDLDMTNAPSDNQVLTYNLAGTNFSWADDQTGGTTAYDDIGDPDASGSISFGSYTGTYTSSTNGWGGIKISNTAANITSASTLLHLDWTDPTPGATNAHAILFTGNAGATEFGAIMGTSVDFGGFTTFEPPNGTSPSPNVDGGIATDTDDDGIEFYDGSNGRLIPTMFTKTATFYEPDNMASEVIPLFFVDNDDGLYGSGIVITKLKMLIPSDAADTVVFLEMTQGTDSLSFSAVIDSFGTTASQYYNEDSSPADGNIAAESWVCVSLGATDVPWMTVQFSYYINDNN